MHFSFLLSFSSLTEALSRVPDILGKAFQFPARSSSFSSSMDSFRCPLQRPSQLLLPSSAPYDKLLSLAAMLHSLDHSAEGSAEASVQFVTGAVSRGHHRIRGSHSLSCIPLLTVPSPHSSLSSQCRITCERSESARERRIALYKSDQ